MSGIEPLFQDFIYVLTALALSFTGYSVFDRFMDRQDKKDVMRSIADSHNTALNSMMGIHSLSKTQEAIEASQKKGDNASNGSVNVEVHHHEAKDQEKSANNVQNK